MEASSPGLAPATLSISAEAVKLRPQVAVFEREVPSGEGISGLWRSAPATAAGPGGGFVGGGGQVLTLRQNGSVLTGNVEGGGGGRGGGGGDRPIAIDAGKVDGAAISFSAANITYAGTMKGSTIELQRTGGPTGGRGGRGAAAEPAGPRPAIGPPPDGSDPSNAAFVGLGRGRGPQTPARLVLQRANR